MIYHNDRAITSQNTYEQVRLKVFLGVLLTSVPINLLFLIYQLLTNDANLSSSEIVYRAIHIAFGIIAFGLLRRRQSVGLVASLTLLLVIPILFVVSEAVTVAAIGAFLLAMMAIFTNRYVMTAGIIAVCFRLTLMLNEVGSMGEPLITRFSLILSVVLILSLTGVVRYFSARTRQTVRDAVRTGELLSATSAIGQVTNRLLDLGQLLTQSVDLIRDRFGYYHVQIFLLDAVRQNAALVASTGEVGRELLARGHSLAVGSRSVIGRVTQLGEPILARSDDQHTIHARNELLPQTRAELALPLFDGETIIGALDVQSVDANAFDPIALQTLQVMASQLAVAIRNIRLFGEQQQSVEVNRRLLAESEQNLQEIERLNRQLTGSVWQDYLQSRTNLSGITLIDSQLQPQDEWTDSMLAAIRKQDANIEGERISVPIILRGQVLGAVEVDTVKDSRRDDAVEVIRTVSEWLAVGLENMRLFQDTQDNTAHEHRTNEIVSQFQTSDSVDDLLQITLKELTETLGAKAGTIRLVGQNRSNTKPPASRPGHQNGDHEA